jgi:hypothetical protein
VQAAGRLFAAARGPAVGYRNHEKIETVLKPIHLFVTALQLIHLKRKFRFKAMTVESPVRVGSDRTVEMLDEI